MVIYRIFHIVFLLHQFIIIGHTYKYVTYSTADGLYRIMSYTVFGESKLSSKYSTRQSKAGVIYNIPHHNFITTKSHNGK